MSFLLHEITFIGQMWRHRTILLALILVTITGAGLQVNKVSSQDESKDWSKPILIDSVQGLLGVSSMDLVPDSSGALHLFYDVSIEDDFGAQRQLNYMHWEGGNWSAPIDIIGSSESGTIMHPKAAIDAAGVIHLVWVGAQNSLYYSSAHTLLASDARNWSTPVALSDGFDEPAIAVGDDGVLYVATTSIPNQALVLLTSQDLGNSWSYPVTIFAEAGSGQPSEIGLDIDGAGRIHVVWTGHTLPTGDPLTGVYYSGSTDGGVTWSVPYEFDGMYHGDINVGTSGRDEVHVAWSSNIGGDGKFHAWSSDGGRSWSNAVLVRDDGGGQSGLPTIVADSSSMMHILFSHSYVAEWKGDRITDVVDLLGESLRETGVWSERAVMAITRGNQLHVVFESRFKELFYTTRILDTPAIATEAVPTPRAEVMTVEEASGGEGASGQSSDIARNVLSAEAREAPATTPAFNSILIAVGASSILILIAVLAMRRRKARRW